MTLLQRAALWTATVLLVATALVAAAFLRDMGRAYARVGSRGEVVASPFGDIEYTQGGSGPPVLVIHGSGGGYDQGELIAEAALGDTFHRITPSRFGYLRSTFHAGATWDEQAHAYAYLLDQLGIDQVAVVAMSHGGPSALMFAVLHPERVASLTLISCGVTSLVTSEQAQANRKGATLTSIYQYDLPYWLASRLFRTSFMRLIGASDAVIAGLADSQQQLVDRFIDYMSPASLRSAGVAFDNAATLPGERIGAITAPTLILHAKDDTLQLFANAEFAAATIPDASLVPFERGGHVVMVVEQAAVQAAVESHISRHRPDSYR